MSDKITAALKVRPSARQLRWQKLEFYGFIHFGMNTFTDQEWGDGKAPARLFNPAALDAGQWAQTFKNAGMRGLILTCKHHDGFCLWPSRYTEYSVKNSPWQGGRGDVVKEAAEACAKEGLAFGIYLSPWDRHEASYGDSSRYNQFFLNQLRELLTGYGPIFSVWLDGACGEGPNGKRQEYDWEAYYALIRELQPEAVISVVGPDVRWCGNEAGHCRESEWSVVPAALQLAERIQGASQKVDDGKFSRRIKSTDEDLGSREAIAGAEELVWYPAEVNTSIRPGWFYHASEDDKVRPLEELLEIYYNSVGGNANFLLNVPPDQRGLIHENDLNCLLELGEVLRETFRHNLAADSLPKTCLEFDLGEVRLLDRVVLGEEIELGQRVEAFTLYFRQSGEWLKCYEGTTIGYKRICRLEPVQAKAIRLEITLARANPYISQFEVYLSSDRERCR